MGQNFGNVSEAKWKVEEEVNCDAKLHPNYFSVNLSVLAVVADKFQKTDNIA